jgi:hypothetical protein
VVGVFVIVETVALDIFRDVMMPSGAITVMRLEADVMSFGTLKLRWRSVKSKASGTRFEHGGSHGYQTEGHQEQPGKLIAIGWEARSPTGQKTSPSCHAW